MALYRNVEDDNGDFHRVDNPEAADRGYDELRQADIDQRKCLRHHVELDEKHECALCVAEDARLIKLKTHANDCAVWLNEPCNCVLPPRRFGTTGFIEHDQFPALNNGEQCCGCITVEIRGDEAWLICNECGAELGSGLEYQA